jgi:hypothetical protein
VNQQGQFPMMLPWFFNQQRQERPDRIPQRVQVAMAMLRQLSEKTDIKIAVNDVGFQEYEGQKLEPEEQQVFLTSCKLLTTYLEGTMKLTKEEKRETDPNAERSLIRCPQCLGQQHVLGKSCDLCRGQGRLSCVPAAIE